MAATLTWAPSPILCFEVNATTGGVTYAITRHTWSGRSQGAHFAFVGTTFLGQFGEGLRGLEAAKRACQEHADQRGVPANDKTRQAAA